MAMPFKSVTIAAFASSCLTAILPLAVLDGTDSIDNASEVSANKSRAKHDWRQLTTAKPDFDRPNAGRWLALRK